MITLWFWGGAASMPARFMSAAEQAPDTKRVELFDCVRESCVCWSISIAFRYCLTSLVHVFGWKNASVRSVGQHTTQVAFCSSSFVRRRRVQQQAVTGGDITQTVLYAVDARKH